MKNMMNFFENISILKIFLYPYNIGIKIYKPEKYISISGKQNKDDEYESQDAGVKLPQLDT